MLYVKFLGGQGPYAVEGLVLVPVLPTDSVRRTSQTHTYNSKHLYPKRKKERKKFERLQEVQCRSGICMFILIVFISITLHSVFYSFWCTRFLTKNTYQYSIYNMNVYNIECNYYYNLLTSTFWENINHIYNSPSGPKLCFVSLSTVFVNSASWWVISGISFPPLPKPWTICTDSPLPHNREWLIHNGVFDRIQVL